MKENELLAFAKLTSKGQITIPKIVREKLNANVGDSIIFYLDGKKNIKISNREDCRVNPENNKGQVVIKRGSKK